MYYKDQVYKGFSLRYDTGWWIISQTGKEQTCHNPGAPFPNLDAALYWIDREGMSHEQR